MPDKVNGKATVIIYGIVIFLTIPAMFWMGGYVIANEDKRVIDAKEIRKEFAVGDDGVRTELNKAVDEFRLCQKEMSKDITKILIRMGIDTD